MTTVRTLTTIPYALRQGPAQRRAESLSLMPAQLPVVAPSKSVPHRTTFGAYAAPQIRRAEQPAVKFSGATDAIDYSDDSMRDIWLDDNPNHSPMWQKANKDADRLLTAAQAKGLNPGPSLFMIVSPAKLLQAAAKMGFPNMPHDWVNGLEMYNQIQDEHYGLSHIYELVINTVPRIAYLVNTNTELENKLVLAHVYGHNDFFGRNKFFKETRPEKILSIIGQHRKELKAFSLDPTIPRDPKVPGNPVKNFLLQTHSVADLIDRQAILKPPIADFGISDYVPPPTGVYKTDATPATLNPADRYLYTTEEWEKKQKDIESLNAPRKMRFPQGPSADILGFVAKHSPVLQPWQRRTLQIKREQSYYFEPQGQTKIMNEGWASFWHNKLLYEDPETTLDQISEFQKVNDGVLSPNPRQLNPYWLGFQMYQHLYIKAGLDIPFDKKLPAEYMYYRLENANQIPKFNEKKALDALYKVVEQNNDYSFIQNYLDEQLAEKLKLYTIETETPVYGEEETRIKSREFKNVQGMLLQMLGNGGRPEMEIVDGNFNDAGELLINHNYTYEMLNIEDTKHVLKILASMWGRPVHIDSYGKNSSNSSLVSIRYTADPKSDEVKVFGRSGRVAATNKPITFDEEGLIDLSKL